MRQTLSEARPLGSITCTPQGYPNLYRLRGAAMHSLEE